MTELAVVQEKPPLPRVPGKWILVAEDNPINQKIVSRMLSRLGYQADVAGNGADAVQLLQQQPYDAILMDLHMPVMDGMEATCAIRQLKGARGRIPIIAVTANVMQGIEQQCFAAGMNDFITKPIDKQVFASALARWTGPGDDNALLTA